MKKSELAKAQYSLRTLAQSQESSVERFVEIISSAFSALATIAPEYALQVIEQLYDQKKEIRDLIKERTKQEAKFIKLAVEHTGPSIEFEEESDEE